MPDINDPTDWKSIQAERQADDERDERQARFGDVRWRCPVCLGLLDYVGKCPNCEVTR